MYNLKFRGAGLIFGVIVPALFVATACSGQSTFQPTSGSQSWNTPGNWSSMSVPSGMDVAVIFPSPTAAETVSLGAAQTVGSLTIHDNSTSTLSALTFSATGGYTLTLSASSGTATALVDGTGVAVESVATALTLSSSLDLTVNNTSVTSSSGAITFTGTITGNGGFIKDGDGTASMTTAAKAYTGATTVNAGVLRTSASGEANATSGLTVNSGGQFRLDSSAGAYQIGSSASTVITLNGAGDANLSGTAGTGALANYGSGASSLANAVQLASATTIYTNTPTTASLTLSGVVSGAGALTKAGTSSLILANAGNTFSGGTTVSGGTLLINAGVSGTGSAAGTGGITVNSGTLGGSGNISGVVTVNGGTLLAGTGTTTTSLTLSSDLTMTSNGSSSGVIGLTLGAGGTPTAGGTHSTLIRGGGNWTFAPMQQFTLSGTPSPGFYDNVIAGLAADPGGESSWSVTNANYVESFTYDGGSGPGNIDLTITSVPEPATLCGGVLLVAAAGWSHRHRRRGLVALLA